MSDFCVEDESVLYQCSPIIRENVRQLIRNNSIGLLPLCAKVVPLENIHSQNHVFHYKDYFKLDIGYAGKTLTWEIIFNREDYEFGPDFITDNQDLSDNTYSFLKDPDTDVIEKHLPSLSNWDVKNNQSLTNVIKELLKLFKSHEVERLKEERFSKIYEEYVKLSESGFDEDNLEIMIDSSNDSVRFLFNIPVLNYDQLPPYTSSHKSDDFKQKKNPSEAKALLSVIFVKPDCSKVQAKLQLSPAVEHAIGNPNSLQMPIYNNTNLADYVTKIKDLLGEKLDQIVTQHNLRNKYISAILALRPNNVVEYDNFLFNSIMMTVEIDDFLAHVLINLGNQFPRQKPQVSLRSVCKMVAEKPYTLEIKNYSYSPRWEPIEMVRRLMVQLEESLIDFAQKHKNS